MGSSAGGGRGKHREPREGEMGVLMRKKTTTSGLGLGRRAEGKPRRREFGQARPNRGAATQELRDERVGISEQGRRERERSPEHWTRAGELGMAHGNSRAREIRPARRRRVGTAEIERITALQEKETTTREAWPGLEAASAGRRHAASWRWPGEKEQRRKIRRRVQGGHEDGRAARELGLGGRATKRHGEKPREEGIQAR